MAIDTIGLLEFADFGNVQPDPKALAAPEVQKAVDECPYRVNVHLWQEKTEIAQCEYFESRIKSTVSIDRTCCARCRHDGRWNEDNPWLRQYACEAVYGRLAPKVGLALEAPFDGEIDAGVVMAKALRGDAIAKRLIDAMFLAGVLKSGAAVVALLEKHGLTDISAVT